MIIVFYCYSSASRCIYFYSELLKYYTCEFLSNNFLFSFSFFFKLFTYLNKATTTQSPITLFFETNNKEWLKLKRDHCIISRAASRDRRIIYQRLTSRFLYWPCLATEILSPETILLLSVRIKRIFISLWTDYQGVSSIYKKPVESLKLLVTGYFLELSRTLYRGQSSSAGIKELLATYN